MTASESLQHYLQRFPGESARLNQLSDFVKTTTPENFFNRKNFTGHITASALIVDSRSGTPKMLMIHHKGNDCWLQPGGHVDAEDPSILDAALREAREETGVASTDLTLLAKDQVPLDIDTHPVPDRPAKQELAHFHHDFRYLFLYSGQAQSHLNADLEETKGLKWMPIDALEKEKGFELLARKIRATLRTSPTP